MARSFTSRAAARAALTSLCEGGRPRPDRTRVGQIDLATLPALIAGTGLGILPEFILREALAADRLERSAARPLLAKSGS
jgi:hypothetical protein